MTSVEQPNLKHATDAANAAALYGRSVGVPSHLPAGATATPLFRVLSEGKASFTFSADKARQAVAGTGQPLPALPAGLDGTTLFVTAGPLVLQTYGEHAMSSPTAGADNVSNLLSALPQLIVAQSISPKVTSTGATVKELEDALVSLPGVSPDLAAQVRAIQDPTSTLPIPVPKGASSRPVKVAGPRGGDGLLVGDDTGVGAAVIWQQGGELYVVAGTLTQDEVMAVANSLQ
jgi:hypothetical protein